MDTQHSKVKNSYTFAFKLKVINFAEQKSKHAASKFFKVDRKRVREWCQNKKDIEEGTKKQKRLSGAGRPVKYKEIDEKLMSWFRERREAGIRVTGKALRSEALRLHKDNGNQSFKASIGWFDKFKKRHNITFRRTTHVAQHSKPIIDDKIDKFLNFVLKMRRIRGSALRNWEYG